MTDLIEVNGGGLGTTFPVRDTITVTPGQRPLYEACLANGVKGIDLATTWRQYHEHGPLTAADRATLDQLDANGRVEWLARRYGNDTVRLAHIAYQHEDAP